MSHAIFASVSAAILPRVLSVLEQAGYQQDEISLLAAAETKLPAALPLTWQVHGEALHGQGPLPDHFTHFFSATFEGALLKFGLQPYAVRHCQTTLICGCVLLVVHTDNGYEPETLVEMLNDCGCVTIAAAACAPASLAAA